MDKQKKDFENLSTDKKAENSLTAKDIFLMISGVILIILCALIISNKNIINDRFNQITKFFQSVNVNHNSEIESNDNPSEFTPFMRNLQVKIKSNWHPPKNDSSNTVEMLFRIAKDGSLISHEILKTSGIPEVDKAAVDALILSSPFEPLPKSHNETYVDVQFTFDYNVLKSN